jgi:DNA-binding CsgD family transcriptional regulator
MLEHTGIQSCIRGICQNIGDQFNLSQRELDVLLMVSLHGYSNKEIAAELFIAEPTVKNHVYSILKKTKSSSSLKLSN